MTTTTDTDSQILKQCPTRVFPWLSLLLSIFLASAPFVTLGALMRGQHTSQPVPKWLDVLLTPSAAVGFFGVPFVCIACLVLAFVNTFRRSAEWWLKVAFWIITFAAIVGSYKELDFIGMHIGK